MSTASDFLRIGPPELSEFRMYLLERLASGDVDKKLIVETIRVLERVGFTMSETDEYMDRMLG